MDTLIFLSSSIGIINQVSYSLAETGLRTVNYFFIMITSSYIAQINSKKMLAGVLIISLLAVSYWFTPFAQAAALTDVSDTLTTQKISASANHTIAFTLATAIIDDGSTITLDFSDFGTGSITEDDIDIAGSTTGEMTTGPDCTSTEEVGIGIAAGVITFTICTGDNGDLASAETVTIEIGTNATASGTGANQMTNPATASASSTDYTVAVAGTMTDSGAFIVPILDDDQVHITATVAEELTFNLTANDDAADFFSASANAIDFGTLSSSAARFATEGAASGGASSEPSGGAHGIFLSTNAAGGYSLTVQGATLTSGANTIDAIGGTGAASSVGSEQFGICLRLDVTGSAGTTATDTAQNGVVDSNYDCTANTDDNYAYGGTASTTDEMATGNASGPTSATVYDVVYITNVNAVSTEAGSYSTSLTYIATGTF